jgi:hypothetical protein
MLRPIVLFCFLIFIGLSACDDNESYLKPGGAYTFTSESIIDWFDLERDLIRSNPGFTAPVAARIYAYTALAVYESILPGMPNYKSYAGLITDFDTTGLPLIEKSKDYNWELVSNSCFAKMLGYFFANANTPSLYKINELNQTYISKYDGLDEGMKERSLLFGSKMAEAIFKYASSDGLNNASNNNFPAYSFPMENWIWKSTDAMYPKPLQPFWGDVRPFLVNDTIYNSFYTPVEFSLDPSSLYYSQVLAVYLQSKKLDSIKSGIVQFWNDEDGNTSTPSGHSISIATAIFKNEYTNLEEAAEIISRMCLALHDAYVATWRIKYRFNRIRPVSYIQDHIDLNYRTMLPTNPTPEYISAHTVQINAATNILELFFGESYAVVDPADNSNTGTTVEHAYKTLYELNTEATYSRFFGGFNFKETVEQSQYLGSVIARNFIYLDLRK